MRKTSLSHPLRIDAVAVPGGGLLGLTFCPGKKHLGGRQGDWDRDLTRDLAAIRAWGAGTLVSLMETFEFARHGCPALGDDAARTGLDWLHWPIRDMDVPDDGFERKWAAQGPALRDRLARGERIAIHCLGGLGRTGLVAARLLIEQGETPEAAIAQVRAARQGAIETAEQEEHVRTWQPSWPPVERP